MALAFYFSPPIPMTAPQYDECIKLLRKAGAGHPAGRLYHSSFGTSESLMVFDVWRSQEAFDAFGKTLTPILEQIGLDPGKPSVMSVHNVIVPPSATKPAKKPVRAKRAASRKGKARPAARRR